jgi:hypothetical protein
LPRSRALDAPVAEIASATRASIAASSSCSGKVAGEDRDLGFLLRGEILAAALPEGLDGFAAGLHLARDDRLDLGIGQLALLRLLRGRRRSGPSAARRAETRHRSASLR